MFGRRGGSGRHARAEQARRSGPRHAAVDRDEGEFDVDPGEYGQGAGPGRRPGGGPYDLADAPEGVTLLDLGSLKVPAVDGVEVRVQADPEGQIQEVVLVNGPNVLQLGVFAAPRSEGIWDEVREEIRKSLFNDGVAAEERDGEFGVELQARVRTPEGLTDIRFVGVDGPRWMVRGVYRGPAAADPGNAGPLATCLRELVVDRGADAKPVREPLPLWLPREVAEQAAAAREGAAATPGEAAAAPGPGQPAAPAPGQPPAPGPLGQLNGGGPVPPPAGPPRRKPSPRPRRNA